MVYYLTCFPIVFSDLKKIAEQPELDPLNEEARRALWHFEHLAAEKEKQKMKEEMIGTALSLLFPWHLKL